MPDFAEMPEDDAVNEENLVLCCALCCANLSLYPSGECFGCSGKVRADLEVAVASTCTSSPPPLTPSIRSSPPLSSLARSGCAA